MLNEQERALAVELLVEAVKTAPAPRTSLVVPLMATTFPIRLRGDLQMTGQLVPEAVRLCLTEGLQQQPTWLDILLVSLVPLTEQVESILARLRNPPPPPPDPLDSLVLATDDVFLNRSTLRKRLRVLSDRKSLKPIQPATPPRFPPKYPIFPVCYWLEVSQLGGLVPQLPQIPPVSDP